MKKLLKALLAIAVILVALVLLHPLWIGPVVRTAVANLAPRFLGVPAHLDGFSLNAYTGRVTLDGFSLDNPPGCTEAQFVTVGHLCVDVDPMTVLSDPVVVREITLKDLYVSIVSDAERVYNYKTISGNCSSGEPEPSEAKKEEEREGKKEAKPSPKVIVDLLQVRTALVQWERIPLPLPSFRLTGIGRSVGGVEWDRAWQEAVNQFIGALGPLAKGLQACLAGTQGSLDGGAKAVSDVTKSVTESARALSDVRNALQSGSQESVDAARKSLDEAAKSLEGSVKSLKSLFK